MSVGSYILGINSHCFLPPPITSVWSAEPKSKSNPHFFLYYPRRRKVSFPKKQGSSSAFPSSNHDSVSFARAKNQVGMALAAKPSFNFHGIDEDLVQKMVHDALVWSSLHGLVVGDRKFQRSGKVPGVGMVHSPFALLPMSFPESHWKQVCELAPIFNELVDRVSLDGKFLQDSLSRTRKVDDFTSKLLDIHSKVLEMNKKEEIRLGLHRSDYMLDEQTNLMLQTELNTISTSSLAPSCLVNKLHRCLVDEYGQQLGLHSDRIPGNSTTNQFAGALAKAWAEYNQPSAAVMVVVQIEEHNMYDQHWLFSVLKQTHNIRTIRKTLAEIDREARLLPDGTLTIDGQAIAVVYFRAGYAPTHYPSDSEWRARLLVEQSSAVKCPSISYHLAGTKKIQQELANPNVLERFLDDKEAIDKLRKCFAGLWSLDDLDTVNKAIERPELFILKPQREGGGNNIYGDGVREKLLELQKSGTEESAAYILMQRIFPAASPAILIRDGICRKENAISELGIFSAYLRNNEKVVINDECGYLMRTKISSSDEGGVIAGFSVLDSIYLT